MAEMSNGNILCWVTVLLCAITGVTSQFTLTPFNLTTVVEGATVTLQCAYTNATAITWLRENVSISSSDYIVNNIGSSQSNLTILSADRNNHNASYSCQATRMDGSTVDFHFNVLVYYLDMVVITMALDRCSGSTVFNGSDVMLTCSIPNAFPSPTIFWYHNTNNVAESPNSNIMFSSDGYILTISRIFPNQSGQWVCEVSNAAGTRRSEPTTLMVDSLSERRAVLQPDVRIGESTIPYLVKRGGRAEFRCVFTPPLFDLGDTNLVIFTRDGVGIQSGIDGNNIHGLSCDVLLSIEPISSEHEGTYLCRHNVFQVNSNTVRMMIATIPQSYSLSMSPKSPIGAGRSVTFTCTSIDNSSGNVPVMYSWQFTSNSTGMSGTVSAVDPRVSITDSGRILTVRDLTVEHSGTWSCVASHPLTANVYTGLSLVVEAPPPVSLNEVSVNVRLGTPLSLICNVTSQRTIDFSWTIGGMSYSQADGRISITHDRTQSTLTLETVEESDLGNVSCVAHDPVHLPVITNVLLTEFPGFYLYGNSNTRNITLELDQPFRLDCDVRGGGTIMVSWFRGGAELPSSVDPSVRTMHFANGTHSLLRNTTVREDSRNDFVCKAETDTESQSLSQRFFILVLIPPQFEIFPNSETHAVQNRRFQLNCVVSGQPIPSITWQLMGTPIRELNKSSVTDLGNGSLVFDSVMASDEGLYSCSINTPSFMFRQTMLIVQEATPTPGTLTQVEIIICVVVLCVAGVFLIIAAVVGVVCTWQYYKRSKITGHFEVRHDSPKEAFYRQPSIRDRKDNSGILSSSPSNDLLESLQKSPQSLATFTYPNNDFAVNPSSIQLDRYSASTALSEKYPTTSYNSTPLHGTVTSTPLHGTAVSTSLFSSDDPTSVTGPLPNFPRSNLELGDVMGEGEFGPVVLGVANHIMPTQDKTLVAVKVLVSRSDEDEGIRPDIALMDFANQMKLSYTNIASILGICSDGEPYYIIYEYLDQGDLKKFLQNSCPEEGDPPTLSQMDMRKIILQVADGMAYLFSQRIIHGDLATRNCLVSSSFEVKIADLGIGHDLYNSDYFDNGTQLLPIRWMPPELLQQMEGEGPSFSLHSDIWSFGVFCWEVFAYARLPYDGFEDNEVLSIVPAGSRLRKPSTSCPDPLYDLMTECWNESPERRPQFARLCVAIVDLDFGRETVSQ